MPDSMQLSKPDLGIAREGKQLGSDISHDLANHIIDESHGMLGDVDENGFVHHEGSDSQKLGNTNKINGFNHSEDNLLGMEPDHEDSFVNGNEEEDSIPLNQHNLHPEGIIEEDKDYFQGEGYYDKGNGDSNTWQKLDDGHGNNDEQFEPMEKINNSGFLRRSQRNIRRQSFSNIEENGFHVAESNDEGHYRLMKCAQFEEGQQPTLIYVSFQALLLMNIHAHLFSNEIIGLGGGLEFKHKKGKKALYIHDAYPAKAVEDVDYDRTKSVEMQPESHQATAKIIETRKQIVCSWYHSHPIFETNPSCMDISNQHNHQMMYSRDNDQSYVGFIVGPYTQKLTSSKPISEFT